MQRYLDEQLKLLKNKLVLMAKLVEKSISMAVKSYLMRNESLAKKVIEEENKINMMEIEIQDACLRLLALSQPVAIDLRFITMCMMINNDLERIGDHAVNIAQDAMQVMKDPKYKTKVNIAKMAEIAVKMVKDSILAFISSNDKLAIDVCKRDDMVDNYNRQVYDELVNSMQKNPKITHRAMDIILISKNIEKIADLSTNICEDSFYIAKGEVIKHHISDKAKSITKMNL